MNKIAADICSELKIRDVMEFYGIRFNKKGFASCPFHTEKTPSLSIYKNRYKCFGCGASGSVVDFVMAYYGLTFKQAVVRLDTDFNLGLTGRKPTYRERVAQAENRRIETAFRNWKGNLQEDYKTLCMVHSILFHRMQKGEIWLEKYLTRLSELLDTFDIEEARNWRMIWK